MSLLGRLYRGETNIDFIGKRKIWFALSLIVLLVSAGSLAIKGLNFGIEFEGGAYVDVPVSDTGPLGGATDGEVLARVEETLDGLGIEESQVQLTQTETGRTVLVQTKEVTTAEERDELTAAIRETTGAAPDEGSGFFVGSRWGGEVTDKALQALIVFLVVVIAFISFRFEWKMAIGAVVALIHDLTITAGIYSLVGLEVTPNTIIAILTILGYSLYDTVVVFDKLEENTELYAASGKMTYQDSANLALNQVFMRSLNTSLSTLLPVATLLFVGAGLLGASTLKDLGLALFVGLLIGAYSSVFVATPLLAMMKEREPRYRNVRERVLRQAKQQSASRTATAGAASGEPVEVGAGAAAVGRPSTSSPRPSARPRAGDRKAKRRKNR